MCKRRSACHPYEHAIIKTGYCVLCKSNYVLNAQEVSLVWKLKEEPSAAWRVYNDTKIGHHIQPLKRSSFDGRYRNSRFCYVTCCITVVCTQVPMMRLQIVQYKALGMPSVMSLVHVNQTWLDHILNQAFLLSWAIEEYQWFDKGQRTIINSCNYFRRKAFRYVYMSRTYYDSMIQAGIC